MRAAGGARATGRTPNARLNVSNQLPPRPNMAASPFGPATVLRRAENGLLYFVGRRDAMIKSAGNRISPQELEDAARSTGLVAEAVALGVADTRLGHAVHLVVRAPLAMPKMPELQLPKLLAKELPNFMQPNVIHWRDTMPLNPNGKIDRAAFWRARWRA